MTSRRGVALVQAALLLWVSCAHVPEGEYVPPGRLSNALRLDSVNVPFRPSSLTGRPVVLAFLASYCLPCVAQIPQLQALHQKYGPAGLRVVIVGMDLEGAKTLGPLAQLYELTFPVLVADASMREGSSIFGRIPALPGTLVIGADEQVLGTFAGLPVTDELTRVVERALKSSK